jgi:hypothetical protein
LECFGVLLLSGTFVRAFPMSNEPRCGAFQRLSFRERNPFRMQFPPLPLPNERLSVADTVQDYNIIANRNAAVS